MTGAQYRLARTIVRCGENITVGAATTKGVVTVLHPEAARKHLPDAEIDSAGRPLFWILLSHDDSLIDTTVIEINGVSATVAKVIDLRIRGVTVCKAAIAY